MSQNKVLFSNILNKVLILQFTLYLNSNFFSLSIIQINELKFVYFYLTGNALIRTKTKEVINILSLICTLTDLPVKDLQC